MIENGVVDDDGCDAHNTRAQTHKPVKPGSREYSSAQTFSQVCEANSSSCENHATASDEGRLDCEAQTAWRSSAIQLDHSSDQSQMGRDQGGAASQSRDQLSREAGRDQEGSTEEGKPYSADGGARSCCEPQQEHCPTRVSDGGALCEDVRTTRPRSCGFWGTRPHDICSDRQRESFLHVMGPEDPSRVRRGLLETLEIGSLGHATSEPGSGAKVQEEPNTCTEGRREQHRQLRFGEISRRPGVPEEVGGSHTDAERSCTADEVGQAQGRRTGSSSGECGLHELSPQEPEGDLSESEGDHEILSAEAAMLLTKNWHLRKNPFSNEWQGLVDSKRIFLMELACFQDSVLSSEVERRLGKGQAVRVADWNGGNLEDSKGVQYAIQVLRKYRPRHLWIACECSPYCPLQHLNKRSPEQCMRLEAKQAAARRQYQGAIKVAEEAWRIGTEVHWELSQRCEAWSLYERKHGLKRVVCNGCTVGLRTRDGKHALCKACGAFLQRMRTYSNT